jgi:hypothetical protein
MHVALYLALRAVVPSDKYLELPLSGHGNCLTFIDAVTNRAFADADQRTFFQMNGTQEQGVMWTPNMDGIQPPPSWCKKGVNRAFQMYDVIPNHDWAVVFDRVEEARDAYVGPLPTVQLEPTYLELYLDRSIMQPEADMLAEVEAYTRLGPDPVSCDTHLVNIDEIVFRQDLQARTKVRLVKAELARATE